MSNNRPTVGVRVLVYNQSNQLLLGKRNNTHGSSTWAPPGGHLEYAESLEECAVREVLEETGFIIENPVFVALTNDIFEIDNKHYVSLFMRARIHNQIISNKKPDKTEEWCWFDLNTLPQELFLPLKKLLSGNSYGLGA